MFYKILNYVFVLVFTLSSASYAGSAAGVLPLFDDGTVLVGKEPRQRPGQAPRYVWGDFGGKQDSGESLHQTALREFKEETAHYSFPKVTLSQVANATYVDHNHTVGKYRMYLVPVHGSKPSITEIVKNAQKAKKKLGRKAHVEKVEWKYVNAQQFLNAVNANAPLPGTKEEIFGPVKAGIKKPAAQNAIQKCIASGKNKSAVAASKKSASKKTRKTKSVKASSKKQKRTKISQRKTKVSSNKKRHVIRKK